MTKHTEHVHVIHTKSKKGYVSLVINLVVVKCIGHRASSIKLNKKSKQLHVDIYEEMHVTTACLSFVRVTIGSDPYKLRFSGIEKRCLCSGT